MSSSCVLGVWPWRFGHRHIPEGDVPLSLPSRGHRPPCLPLAPVRMYDGADASAIPHWEWVTGVQWPENVRGGPIASNVTALVFDEGTGALYIGNNEALNVMYANGTIVRVDGLSGLPYANITSLAVQVACVV